MKTRMVILNFHGIGHPSRPFWPREQLYWVERQLFEAVMDLVEHRSDTLVTFDDCNASDFDIGFPALQKRGMKAHFYVVSEFLDQQGFLSKSQVRELHAAGMIIGNHGKFHRSWRGLPERELQEELVQARETLEDLLSDQVRYAACPNGSYDRRVLRQLRACGYERVYTSDRGWTRRDGWLQARNSLLRSLELDDIRGLLNSSPFGWSGLVRFCKGAIKQWR